MSDMGLLSQPDGLTDEERKYFETRGESGLTVPGETPAAPAAPPTPPAAPPSPPAAAPAPPQQTAPEPLGEDDDDDEGEGAVDQAGKPIRRIPLRKFKALEERYSNTNKELSSARARQQELEQILSRADERLKIINEALAQPEPRGEELEPEDPRPDPRIDVFAYMDWKERQDARTYQMMREQLDGLNNRHGDIEEQQQAQLEQTQLVNAFRNDALAYAQGNPNFGPAYQFLMGMRDAQYEALGLADRNVRRDRINAEEAAIVRSAYAEGMNPADRLYRVAVASGYRPNGNGAAPMPMPPAPAPAAANVAAEIAAARNGQRAALSLSQGGGAPADQLTSQLLADMPQDQFNRIKERIERTNPLRWRELMGG